MEIANRIRDAVQCGLKVLEDAFDMVEVDNTGGRYTVEMESHDLT